MIRRDHVNANGLACWVLISQQDHARLAGELALSWGAAPWTRQGDSSADYFSA